MSTLTKSLTADYKFQALLIAALAAIGVEVYSWTDAKFYSIWFAITAGIFCALVGFNVLKKGLTAISKGKFTSINLLVTIAAIGAFAIGEYPEAMVVIALFALGEKLEDFGISSSKAALKKLAEKTPRKVEIKGQGLIDLELVKLSDLMIIKAGSYLGLDGVVESGSGLIDEASLTGESLPRAIQKGDKVFSGTHLLNGYFEVKVSKLSKDSTISRILELTAKATGEKANFQRFIERFSKFYTPTVLILAILIFLVPVLLGQNWHKWLEQALTILLISCPCALVVSTPISVFAAIGNAASQGILIKGGRYLETLSQVNIIAMDKTRTITFGRPVVIDVVSLGHMDQDEVLACAAGIEALSEHPLAISIVNEAKKRNLSPHSVGQYQTILGKGAQAECYVCQNKAHFIGNRSLAIEKLTLPPGAEEKLQEFSNQGKTNVVLWAEQAIEGIISLRDQIKPEAIQSIAQLKNFGIQSLMLTGDSKAAANAVSIEVGISDTRAELLPEDKANIISKLVAEGHTVAMVGDGINDAPALASASIGIAMGAAGSDVAIEAANIALMNDKLELLPYLVALGKKTWSTIRFNAGLAITVKVSVLIVAIFGYSSLTLAIVSDVGLLIFVVFFSLQLLHWKPTIPLKI